MNYLYNDLNMRTKNEKCCTRFDYATKRKYDRNAQLRIIAGLRLLSIKIVESKSSLNQWIEKTIIEHVNNKLTINADKKLRNLMIQLKNNEVTWWWILITKN